MGLSGVNTERHSIASHLAAATLMVAVLSGGCNSERSFADPASGGSAGVAGTSVGGAGTGGTTAMGGFGAGGLGGSGATGATAGTGGSPSTNGCTPQPGPIWNRYTFTTTWKKDPLDKVWGSDPNGPPTHSIAAIIHVPGDTETAVLSDNGCLYSKRNGTWLPPLHASERFAGLPPDVTGATFTGSNIKRLQDVSYGATDYEMAFLSKSTLYLYHMSSPSTVVKTSKFELAPGAPGVVVNDTPRWLVAVDSLMPPAPPAANRYVGYSKTIATYRYVTKSWLTGPLTSEWFSNTTGTPPNPSLVRAGEVLPGTGVEFYGP